MKRAKCNIKGCKNWRATRGKHADGSPNYRPTCASHYHKLHDRYRATNCEICGWEGPCDRHRIIWAKDGGKYAKGNKRTLCPNCHRLVHFGMLEVR